MKILKTSEYKVKIQDTDYIYTLHSYIYIFPTDFTW